MPVYVFACPACGRFELTRPMTRAGEAAACPECGREARRVFTPPNHPLLRSEVRRALGAEEASAHEPRVVSQTRGRPLRHRADPTPPWVLH
ncbi:FmdB family zinc ribbon protein [Pseudonocardia sp. T1-2H]|uniref:FmdB family zinc ribbon protein n=1 Tax=Pseudonocardia sp. T1-2H TaxID=3128899 RepID=UPI003100F61E